MKPCWVRCGLAIAASLLVILNHLTTRACLARVGVADMAIMLQNREDRSATATASLPAGLSLPPPNAHPLPPTLAQWQDITNSGDYFSQVQPTEVGYLVWSQFPVTVYAERPASVVGSGGENQGEPRDRAAKRPWMDAVLQAIAEWQAYIPLELVDSPETADITIWRQRPPLRLDPNGQLPRVRAAETTYELFVSPANILSHRCSIFLTPDQTFEYTRATARHELGHALGIWGHSPLETDVMYFSQVRHPPSISPRDINTLQRIYQQPTRLGWSID